MDAIAARRGTLEAAEAYLRFLYTNESQELIASHGFRPVDGQDSAARGTSQDSVALLRIDKDFGGWAEAHAMHFTEGAIFDQIYTPDH